MKNPYQLLLEQTEMSQRNFASYAGFSRTTLTYVLEGLYPDLSDGQIIALGKLLKSKGIEAKPILLDNYGFETLREAYAYWRAEERRIAGVRLRDYVPRAGEGWWSPMRNMVVDTVGGEHAFSNLLKIAPAPLMRYSSGQAKHMPAEIDHAFTEIGYPRLDTLKSLQSEWRATQQ